MGEEAQSVIPTAPRSGEPSPEVPKEEVEPVVPIKEQHEEKATEERAVDVPEDEEKTVETVEESQEGKAETDRELVPSSGEETAASFKEESYFVKDLKESEKKALQDLKAKIEEAIKTNSFLAPPKLEVTKETETEKTDVEVVTGEGEAKVKETEVVEREVVLEEAPGASTEPAAAEVVDVTEEKPPPPAVAPEEAVAEEEVVKEVAPPVREVSETPTETEEETAAPPDVEAAEEVEKTTRDMEAEEFSPCLENLSLWGVPLLHSRGGERSDVILLKFLRARDFKVNDAFGMLQETLVWRKDFKADNLVEEDISHEYESVAYMHGVDKEGHPVCYNHYGVFQDKELYQKTFEDDTQFNNFLRWRIQVVEKSIQKLDFSANGVHSVVHIIDMKDSPGFAKRRNITKKAFTLLQDNYPELVAKQVFINVPWYFGALYNLHMKIVTPRSKSKVVVARPGKVTETLFKYISPENVPMQYGGLSKPDDHQFDGVEVEELIVKAGEKQSIEIPVSEAGCTVVWDITVVGWEVTYGEEFVPSAEGSYTVIIQKTKKVASSEEPMRNTFKAFEPGKVVLNIDNAVSRRKRRVVYRHLVNEAAPPPPPEPPVTEE